MIILDFHAWLAPNHGGALTISEGGNHKMQNTVLNHWGREVARKRILERFGADLEMSKKRCVPALSVEKIRSDPVMATNIRGISLKTL